MVSQPDADPALDFSSSVNSMNFTLEPKVLFTSTMLFSKFPAISTKSETRKPHFTSLSYAAAASTARSKMSLLMAKLSLDRALIHVLHIFADIEFQLGDKIIV